MGLATASRNSSGCTQRRDARQGRPDNAHPAVGSLGTVIELAREAYGSQPVPLLFAQPDFGRYTVFGHHFARDGDRVWRLDRQPTMSRHPVTPMGESDLAVHLGRQTRLPIASVPESNQS